jgi:hypothetical protein
MVYVMVQTIPVDNPFIITEKGAIGLSEEE